MVIFMLFKLFNSHFTSAVFTTCRLLGRPFVTKLDRLLTHAVFQPAHIVLHLRVGHVGVDLRGDDSFVSHHAADRFDRHAHRQGNVRSEVVSRLVKGQMLDAIESTQLANQRLQLAARADGQQPLVGALRTVFFEDTPRHPQQRHDRFRVGLLPPYANPQRAVLRPFDMSGREASQIGIGQPREGREDEPVARTLQLGVGDLLCEQPFEVFGFQMTARALGQFGMQVAVRVAAQRPLTDGPAGHLLQSVEVLVYGFYPQAALRTQEQIERIVERRVETAQRNVLRCVLFPHERREVVIGVFIAGMGLLRAVDADPFAKLLVVLPKQRQQHRRLLPDAFHGILHRFGRHEAEVAADAFVMTADDLRKTVDRTVYLRGVAAFAVGASRRRIPEGRIDRDFRTDLLGSGVDADFA